jgi:DHA1 family tetracycline resistance protein-like MFS transporter
MAKTKENHKTGRALSSVLLTVFIDVLGIGILIPVLPQLIFTIFIPAGFTRSESLILLGWLTAIYPLMQFVATPILGQLSDRHGRRPVLALSLLGTAIGYALFAIGIITKNIPLLFFSRAFDGITGGNISVARAVVADVSKPKDRTKNFGLLGAMFGIGFVLGPYLGSRLSVPNVSFFGLFDTPSWFGSAVPFWFTAILSFFNMLLIVFLLPETHKHINKLIKIKWTQALINIEKAATNKNLRVVFASEFFYYGGFTFFTTFFQILLIEKLGFKTNNVGDFFAYIGIWIAVTQATITPFLAKRMTNQQVLRFSLMGTGLALFLQLFVGDTRQLLLAAPFIAIFNGLTLANTSAIVSLSADKTIQGEVLGIEASVQALAQAIPAIIAGYTATIGINVPIIIGGSIMVLSGLIFNIFYRPPKQLVKPVPGTDYA